MTSSSLVCLKDIRRWSCPNFIPRLFHNTKSAWEWDQECPTSVHYFLHIPSIHKVDTPSQETMAVNYSLSCHGSRVCTFSCTCLSRHIWNCKVSYALYRTLLTTDHTYMSMFANNALLEGGVRVRVKVWIRDQRKIKRRLKALPSFWWQTWTSLNLKELFLAHTGLYMMMKMPLQVFCLAF